MKGIGQQYFDYIDYCFELETGDCVFVEVESNIGVDEAREYLEKQVDCEVVDYIGEYSVEEAEMLGYDTF